MKYLLALAISVAASSPALAAGMVDCPMRDQPYSIDSPLMDVMLKPEARAIVDKALPDLVHNLPPMMTSTVAPAFSAIMSLRTISKFAQTPESTLAPINTALAALPVTAADKVARCGRYDTDKPIFAASEGKMRVLLFEKMTGFRDGPSVIAAKAMITDMAARNGWALAVTDRGGAINPATLKKFDVVIWNNISGDVLTLSQRRAFKSWIEQGGGFVGMHGTAGDPTYFWDWYPDTLIGGRFIGHPMAPQFQDAQVRIEQTKSGIGNSLSPGWMMKDEWYSFKASPRLTGANVIATLDEASYSPVGMFKQDLRMGDHPIAWSHCIGNGRSFYSAIGHRPEGYSEDHHVRLVEQAIGWAAGKGQTLCKAGKEVARGPK
ncbi:MAG: hypothetical protein RL367_1889 [Pseudomonadota bacterium]